MQAIEYNSQIVLFCFTGIVLKGHEAYYFFYETIHYSNKIRSHLVTIAPMAPFTPKSILKLRCALHFRYSIVNPPFLPLANTAQS